MSNCGKDFVPESRVVSDNLPNINPTRELLGVGVVWYVLACGTDTAIVTGGGTRRVYEVKRSELAHASYCRQCGV